MPPSARRPGSPRATLAGSGRDRRRPRGSDRRPARPGSDPEPGRPGKERRRADAGGSTDDRRRRSRLRPERPPYPAGRGPASEARAERMDRSSTGRASPGRPAAAGDMPVRAISDPRTSSDRWSIALRSMAWNRLSAAMGTRGAARSRSDEGHSTVPSGRPARARTGGCRMPPASGQGRGTAYRRRLKTIERLGHLGSFRISARGRGWAGSAWPQRRDRDGGSGQGGCRRPRRCRDRGG